MTRCTMRSTGVSNSGWATNKRELVFGELTYVRPGSRFELRKEVSNYSRAT